MTLAKKSLLGLLILVLVCALFYWGWFGHRERSASEQNPTGTAHSPSGAPDAFRSAAPPPQP